MPRIKMTDAERAAKKKAQWDKIVAGQPNPSGIKGGPEVWAGIAEELFGVHFSKVKFEKTQGEVRIKRVFVLLGLTGMPATHGDLKRARNTMLRTVHPDYGGSHEATLELLKAYGEICCMGGWEP